MATVDLQGGDAQRIRGQYRTSLGREAAEHEVEGWLSGRYHGGGNIDAYLNAIDTSHEAQQRRPQPPRFPPSAPGWPENPPAPQRQPVSHPTVPVVGTNPDSNRLQPPSPPGGTSGGANPAPYTGFTPRHDYSAFNTGRQQDPGKSAKDAFAMLSNQAPPPPFHNKAALSQWFTQYIAPGMNALGHRIVSLSDDGFTFENHEGRFFVDFAQNAGAPSGSMQQRLQWNTDPADEATRRRYAGGPQAPPAAPPVAPPTAPIPQLPPGGGGPGGGPQLPPERQAPAPGVSSFRNLGYWQAQGVPTSEIFDPTSGQLKPGWVRTANGYDRPQRQPASASVSSDDLNGGAPGGPAPSAPPSSVTLLSSPEAERIRQQYRLSLGREAQDHEVMGWLSGEYGGGGIDQWLVQIAGSHEAQQRRAPSAPPAPPSAPSGPGGGPGGVGTGVNLPSNQYSDEHTRLLEELALARIGSLQGGWDDPFRDQYMQAMERRTKALEAAEPQYQQLRARMTQRIGDLQGPGYTGAENEAIRTGALDPIEQDRTAAKKRMMEQLSARGITMESGVAQQALMEIDKAFDGMRASTQTVLTTNDLGRREGRQSRADAMSTGLYDVEQSRQREQLDTFGAMEALEMLGRNEEAARSREQLSLAGILADLGPNRLQLAMQAVGMGGSPQSMFQSLMQLAQLNQNSALLNSQQSGRLWSGLGSMAAILANAGR